jgi:hypothetical protein
LPDPFLFGARQTAAAGAIIALIAIAAIACWVPGFRAGRTLTGGRSESEE